MNKQQLKDSQLCEEMQNNGEDMECFGCSCNVCIAQEPSNKYQLMQILSTTQTICEQVELLDEASEEKEALLHNSDLLMRQIKQVL